MGDICKTIDLNSNDYGEMITTPVMKKAYDNNMGIRNHRNSLTNSQMKSSAS
jgi:hypothetical protein